MASALPRTIVYSAPRRRVAPKPGGSPRAPVLEAQNSQTGKKAVGPWCVGAARARDVHDFCTPHRPPRPVSRSQPTLPSIFLHAGWAPSPPLRLPARVAPPMTLA